VEKEGWGKMGGTGPGWKKKKTNELLRRSLRCQRAARFKPRGGVSGDAKVKRVVGTEKKKNKSWGAWDCQLSVKPRWKHCRVTDGKGDNLFFRGVQQRARGWVRTGG